MDKIEFEIVTLDWKKVQYTELPTDSGLYQIYGTSPLYGMDTLLYIGQAEDLIRRVKTHFENEFGTIGRQPNKSCRYAKLDGDLLDSVEEILIIMHKPSFNSARLINVSKMNRDRAFYIQNHGDRGLLNNELTNYYFLNSTNSKVKPEDVFLSPEIK